MLVRKRCSNQASPQTRLSTLLTAALAGIMAAHMAAVNGTSCIALARAGGEGGGMWKPDLVPA